jgi:hypothetical protein
MPSRPALAAAVVVAALMSAPFPGRGDDPRMAIQPEKGPQPITVDRTDEKGVVSGGRVESMTANVKSIDLAKREVTLHGPGGRVETIQAGPEVKNLEKLEVGDRVTIRYRAGLVLRLQPPGAEDAAPEASNKLQRTGRGDVLAGTETVRARATVTVASLDAASRVVTLQGADGKIYLVKAGPDIALDRVKVGDRFAATYSAALAVSVEPIHRE